MVSRTNSPSIPDALSEGDCVACVTFGNGARDRRVIDPRNWELREPAFELTRRVAVAAILIASCGDQDGDETSSAGDTGSTSGSTASGNSESATSESATSGAEGGSGPMCFGATGSSDSTTGSTTSSGTSDGSTAADVGTESGSEECIPDEGSCVDADNCCYGSCCLGSGPNGCLVPLCTAYCFGL